MKTLILVFVSIFTFISCNNSETNNLPPQNITPVLIGKGELSGNGKENISQQNIVIANQSEFNGKMFAKGGFSSTSLALRTKFLESTKA